MAFGMFLSLLQNFVLKVNWYLLSALSVCTCISVVCYFMFMCLLKENDVGSVIVFCKYIYSHPLQSHQS